jgi:hypothetical protein
MNACTAASCRRTTAPGVGAAGEGHQPRRGDAGKGPGAAKYQRVAGVEMMVLPAAALFSRYENPKLGLANWPMYWL